jgi:hypothetical protein
VPVPVMRIGHMRVLVLQGRMRVPVAVGAVGHGLVRVQVVSIVV